jgi:TRAP-type C4-dicarboxylate transport system substrate-binding protein
MLAALVAATAAPQTPGQAVEVVKLATLAPEGSTWMLVLNEYDAAVRRESGGRLELLAFAGGVAGAEPDVLRKIRFGQLDGAGLTGLGLGLIATEERALEGPFVFDDYAQVDAVHAAATPEIERELQRAGFLVLGWAEVGFVYLFTKTPVTSVADLQRLRLWAWEGDPVADATFDAWGVSPVRLPIADVFTALQTGGIDGVYAAPLGLIALQWHSHVRYMLEMPLGSASGALVIAERRYGRLAPQLQDTLLRNGRIYMAELRQRSRADNAAAIATLAERGITRIQVAAAERADFVAAAAVARQSLVPRIYSQQLLDTVEAAVQAVPAAGR